MVFCSWNNSIPAIIHPSFAAASSFLPLAPFPSASVSFPPSTVQPSLPVRVFVSIFPASRKNCNCIKDAPSRVPWSRANLPAISIYLLIDSLQWNLASRVDDIRRFTPPTRVICYGVGAFTCGIFAEGRRYVKIFFFYFDRTLYFVPRVMFSISQFSLVINFDVRSSDLPFLRHCVNSQFIFKRYCCAALIRTICVAT